MESCATEATTTRRWSRPLSRTERLLLALLLVQCGVAAKKRKQPAVPAELHTTNTSHYSASNRPGSGWQPCCSARDNSCESQWGVWSEAALRVVAQASFSNKGSWEGLPVSRYRDALAPTGAPARHLIHCMPHCTRGSTLYRNLDVGSTSPPGHSIVCKTGLWGTRDFTTSQYAFNERPSYLSSLMLPCLASLSNEASSICCMPAIPSLHGLGLSMDNRGLGLIGSAHQLEIKCNPIGVAAFRCKTPCCGTLQRVYEVITQQTQGSLMLEHELLQRGENFTNGVVQYMPAVNQTEGCHLHSSHGPHPIHHFTRVLMNDIVRLVSHKLSYDYSLAVTIFKDAQNESTRRNLLHNDSHCIRRRCASDESRKDVSICFDLFDYLPHNTWSANADEKFLQSVGMSLVNAVQGLLVSV